MENNEHEPLSAKNTLTLTLWYIHQQPLQRVYTHIQGTRKIRNKKTTRILVMSFLFVSHLQIPWYMAILGRNLAKFDPLEVKHNQHDRILHWQSQILEITTASIKFADDEHLIDHLREQVAKISKSQNPLRICARKSKIIYMDISFKYYH